MIEGPIATKLVGNTVYFNKMCWYYSIGAKPDSIDIGGWMHQNGISGDMVVNRVVCRTEEEAQLLYLRFAA